MQGAERSMALSLVALRCIVVLCLCGTVPVCVCVCVCACALYCFCASALLAIRSLLTPPATRPAEGRNITTNKAPNAQLCNVRGNELMGPAMLSHSKICANSINDQAAGRGLTQPNMSSMSSHSRPAQTRSKDSNIASGCHQERG